MTNTAQNRRNAWADRTNCFGETLRGRGSHGYFNAPGNLQERYDCYADNAEYGDTGRELAGMGGGPLLTFEQWLAR